MEGEWTWRVWSITRSGEIAFSEVRTFVHLRSGCAVMSSGSEAADGRKRVSAGGRRAARGGCGRGGASGRRALCVRRWSRDQFEGLIDASALDEYPSHAVCASPATGRAQRRFKR